MKILAAILFAIGCGSISDCPTLTPPASQPDEGAAVSANDSESLITCFGDNV